MAAPWPTPTHMVAKPYLVWVLCIWWSKVAEIRAPEQPNGCPKAIAPPFTLTMDSFNPKSLIQAMLCDAKASFNSTKPN